MNTKNLILSFISLFCLTQIQAQYNLVLENINKQAILFSIEVKKTAGAEQIIISRGDELRGKGSLSSSLLHGDYSRKVFEAAVQITIQGFNDFTVDEVSSPAAKEAIKEVYEEVLLTRLPLKALNEERGAGIIQVLNREIELFKMIQTDTSKKNKSCKKAITIRELDELKRLKESTKKIEEKKKNVGEVPINKEASPRGEFNIDSEKETWEIDSTVRLIIKQVSFKISDNFINRITIDGVVTNGISEKEVSIDNMFWSLALKKFDHQTNSVVFNGTRYHFSYGDILLYKATGGGSKSYHVQDAEFALQPFQEKMLLKRGLDQYLGINIFNDYFGLYASNPNSPLSMSFSANIPFNLSQLQRGRHFQKAKITINTAILNNFGGIGGFGKIVKHQPSIDTNSQLPIVDTFMLDHFDLIRFRNFSASGYFTTIGLEAKKLNLTFHIGLGAELYVSRFQYTEVTDSIDIANTYSIVSGAPFVNFVAEYRPDQFFGIDMEARMKYLTMLTSSNAIPQLLESAGLYENGVLNKGAYNEMNFGNRLIFSVEVDLFAHINKKGKSGVFAKVGGELGFNNANIFPMIVLGYSTNLDAYINSVREE